MLCETDISSLFVAVGQSLSFVQLFATPWTVAHQASLFFTISWSLLKVMSIVSVMPSNHLIPCHSLLLLPSIFPSIRVFSNELALGIRWPDYWSFLSNGYSGLISFRIDDLISLQSKGLWRIFSSSINSKASILLRSAFFMVQHSHPYLTTGETTPLTIWIFVGKMMSAF